MSRTHLMSLLAPLPLTVLFACAPATDGASSEEASAQSPPLAATGEVMTQEAQQAMSPEQVLAELEEGNRRFVDGRSTSRDYRAQAAATAAGGQYPKAIVLGCLDSRVPPEIVFDQGIGDIFVGRVAGNFENQDLLGSMEFGARVAGSKVIVVLGHTSCGAVKGAADAVELGNLTASLENLDGALAAARTESEAPYDSSNGAYIRAAIEENVRQTMADILAGSAVLSEMVEGGELLVAGGVYDLASGRIDWLDS